MNSTDLAKRRAPPCNTLAELQSVIRQIEEILGPLVVIESDSTDTIMSFDEGRDTPATLVTLERDLGGLSSRDGLDEFVTRGVCIIAGDRLMVSAHRSAFRAAQTVSTDIPPEGRALLDTIAATESPGYDVLYGGRKFTDFSQHPNIAVPKRSGPNKGKTSTAAGRYQFIFSTWTAIRRELRLADFTPQSQDKAAWHLAQTEYQRREQRGLLNDLKNRQLDRVGPALHSQWTSLPGGVEQGVNANRFVKNYTINLAKHEPPERATVIA
jgi:muramidase (phage lysozyme)